MPDLIDTKLQKLGNQLSGRLSMPADNRYAVATAVPNALDSAYADRKAELLRWLIEEGRFAPDTGCLLEMLCEKLTGLGAPIARATAHVRTLHPEFRGYRASGGVDRVPRSEPRGTVSSLRQITRIVPLSMSSKPDSGLMLFLAKPPTGASRSSRRCGRKALRIT